MLPRVGPCNWYRASLGNAVNCLLVTLYIYLNFLDLRGTLLAAPSSVLDCKNFCESWEHQVVLSEPPHLVMLLSVGLSLGNPGNLHLLSCFQFHPGWYLWHSQPRYSTTAIEKLPQSTSVFQTFTVNPLGWDQWSGKMRILTQSALVIWHWDKIL